MHSLYGQARLTLTCWIIVERYFLFFSVKVNAIETKTGEKFSGQATVVVTVNDENDNNPEFTQENYEFIVSEGDAGTVVGFVKVSLILGNSSLKWLWTEILNRSFVHTQAVDKDIGLSGQVKYSLSSDK